MNVKEFTLSLSLFALVLVPAGCSENSGSTSLPGSGTPSRLHRASASSPITHVIIIVQENRTFDNLFNGFPGANTQNYGYNSYGQTVQLQPERLTAPYDLSHTHASFLTDWANGYSDGWNLEHWNCKSFHAKKCPVPGTAPYAYVPTSDILPYWHLAEQYTLADDMFESGQGPSFPEHQYLVSGTSTIADGSSLRAAEEPLTPGQNYTGGCNSPYGSTVLLIDQYGNENQTAFPCFDRDSLMDEAKAAGLSWHYYQSHPAAGPWDAPNAIKPIWEQKTYYNAHVSHPPSKVLADIANGNLASIVWVTPTASASDHAGLTDGSGPSWVASVVNAIGESQYWNSSAIILTWDDWGGWFDHVVPTVRNSYELGYRVPLVVISPYAKQGYVSHVQYEFGSILKFVEATFGLPSLGTTDVNANNLTDCFDFYGSVRRFKHISAKYSAQHFLHSPQSTEDPDASGDPD